MTFADIHIHALFGVDDGPDSTEKMTEIIDRAYLDGTRFICLTPHYTPDCFGENSSSVQVAFEKLKKYSEEKYPDLKLFPGNELRYDPSAVNWIKEGLCRTLNSTRYVLVDFSADESLGTISQALTVLLNAGYIPILAHAERYSKLKKLSLISDFKNKGVLIQIDTGSLFGEWGTGSKIRSRKLVSAGLADIAASDAHNISSRPPEISKGYEYIKKHTNKEYADRLCLYNPLKILGIDA